jgi:hypothetical protein
LVLATNRVLLLFLFFVVVAYRCCCCCCCYYYRRAYIMVSCWGRRFGKASWLLVLALVFCFSLCRDELLVRASAGDVYRKVKEDVAFVEVNALSGGAINEGCEWTDPTTRKHYDISSLTKTVVGDEYVFKQGDWAFKANICGRATSKCNLPTIPPGSTPVAFQYQSSATLGDVCTASLGDLMSAPVWSTFKKQNGKFGFQITYTGGSGGCRPPAPPTRSVTYKFTCDRSQRGTAQLVFAEESSACSYTLEFKTGLACRGHRRFSATGFLLFLFLFSAFIYCFIEVTDNIQKGAQGMELIPHRDLIVNYFELVQDGCYFTKELLGRLWSSGRSGYSSIPQRDQGSVSRGTGGPVATNHHR